MEEGADLLDLGGESSRPGSEAVSLDEELARVLPVLDGLRDLAVPISVDTTKPAVMRAAIAGGAAMINDITALGAPGALEAVAASEAAVCLMHMQGEPRRCRRSPCMPTWSPRFATSSRHALRRALRRELRASASSIDPGFGFGKTVEHNLTLLRELGAIVALGVPVLAGWSRKSSLGRITGRAAEERLGIERRGSADRGAARG